MAQAYDAILITDTPTMGRGKYAGVSKVASDLRKNGFKALVVDCFLEFGMTELEKVFRHIVSPQTLFVGFSSTFLYSRFKPDGNFIPRKFTPFLQGDKLYPLGRPNEEIKTILRIIRDLNPRIKIVVGGSAVSRSRSDFLEFGFDYLFEKESDVSILHFARSLRASTPEQILSQPISEMSSTKVISSSSYPFHHFSDSEIVWDESDLIEEDEALPIEIARGCIFRCKFCDYNMNGKKINEFVRSEDSLYGEFMRNYRAFGTTKYLLADDLINDSLTKLRMLERVVDRLPFKIEWSSYARLDLLWKYPEMIPLLEKLGAKFLLFGIETLNDKSGLSVGKGLGKKRVLETLEKCSAGWSDRVMMASGFIIGLPQETISSVENTFKWVVSKDCPLIKASFTSYILESSFTDQSEISKDHQKYGYELVEDGRTRKYWKNEHMTQIDAQRMMYEFNNSGSSKFSYMEAGFFHRFHNLKSNLDYLALKSPEIDKVQRSARLRYKEKLLSFLFRSPLPRASISI